MQRSIIRANNNADYSPVHAIEAFYDISQAARFSLFDNITLDPNPQAPTLTYTVTATGVEVTKEFNPETFKADLITHLFSMLDASANL